jgi:phenylpyruvate tautomerase PptA (4-oxalocrotonate tautomerase family)
MPLLELTYPSGALSEEDRNVLANELTTVLLRAEGAPDTDFFRGITWVHVHELAPGAMLAAGRPVGEPTFLIRATVPQGALSDRRKERLVAEATRAVSDIAGLSESDGLRVWVLVNEVPEGNWGAAGNVVHFEQLRQLAAEQRDGAAEAAGAVR